MNTLFRASPLALFLLPLFVVAGCSDDSSKEGAADGESSDSLTACGDYFDALSGVGPRCLNGASLDSDLAPARREGFLKECAYTISLPGIPDTFVSNLAACAKKLGSLSCDVLVDEDDPCGLVADRGTKAAGESCEESLQCASGHCAVDGQACGTCAAEVAEGASCDDDKTVCNDSSTCMIPDGAQTQEGTCEARKAAGAACDEDDFCTTGLACVGGTCEERPKLGEACEGTCAGFSFCQDSVCTALPKVGEACLGEYGVCAYGLECSESTEKCEKRAAPTAALGAACEDSSECKEGYCKRSTSGDEGVCTAYAKLGEACKEESELLCEGGLRCNDDKCVELTPLCTK